MKAPVFLSASTPDPRRSDEYWNSRNLLNVREAVRAFCGHTLTNFPVVFGGHPAITPLVKRVVERITSDARLHEKKEEKPGEDPEGVTPQERLFVTFQSGLFVDRESSEDEVVTEPLNEKGRAIPRKSGVRNESLLHMRYEMIAKPT